MTHAPDDYALVVGINDYPQWNDGAKSLRGSVKDACDFRDWLVDAKGGGLNAANVKLIVSTDKPLGPRQHVIDDALDAIREQSDGRVRRRFYFYFSGHGHSRAGSGDEQSLCLANWSPKAAGAALHLQSYIKTAVGCLKFDESVFFLDCCRVRAVAPLGQQSELECGDPQMGSRCSAILYGSDHYDPSFEGEVDAEIRGYFTAGMLKVLREGTIEIGELVKRLRLVVPDLAKPRKQTVRAVPADREIFLGPPDDIPPDGYGDEQELLGGTRVAISVESNLTGDNADDDEPAPKPGEITVVRADGRVVERALGSVVALLPPGRYGIRIDHGEAWEIHTVNVGIEPLNLVYQLPRRSSATLLSSTLDKREHRTAAVVAASRWDASSGGQGAFVSVRSKQDGDAFAVAGSLYLHTVGRRTDVIAANTLLQCPPGIASLIHERRPGEGLSILPIPVARSWDTHVFVLTDEGRPQLATASVSMRPAGKGFDPSDALIDAYERGIADLVSGGPGPDEGTLDTLLWGKYRNPLFGLLGAHFLIRKLRAAREPNAEELNRLEIVAGNLGHLLGEGAPDVVALRLWKQLISKQQPTETLRSGELPLFSVGFQAFVEATALSDAVSSPQLDNVALTLNANSPWTLWSPVRTHESGGISSPDLTTFGVTATASRAGTIRRIWLGKGFTVTTERDGDRYRLRATKVGDVGFDALDRAETILSVPDSLIGYMRGAIAQSERKGAPLNLAQLVRRTKLPRGVLVAAKALVDDGAVGEFSQPPPPRPLER